LGMPRTRDLSPTRIWTASRMRMADNRFIRTPGEASLDLP
jgi:hypothetical protein